MSSSQVADERIAVRPHVVEERVIRREAADDLGPEVGIVRDLEVEAKEIFRICLRPAVDEDALGREARPRKVSAAREVVERPPAYADVAREGERVDGSV